MRLVKWKRTCPGRCVVWLTVNAPELGWVTVMTESGDGSEAPAAPSWPKLTPTNAAVTAPRVYPRILLPLAFGMAS